MSRLMVGVLAVVFILAACNREERESSSAQASVPPTAVQPSTQAPEPAAAEPRIVAANLPVMTVHKSPTCPCCVSWIEHMRHAGFQVTVKETHEIDPIRQRLGVPAGKGSCHTAEVGGLVIEGHVPAEDIQRLLADRRDARGLALLGMPIGSPGMESPDGRVEHYVVERINEDGSTSPYAEHGPENTP